jgi:C_GCAxxG_C_C family probable redox protein
MSLEEQARRNFDSGYNCAESVLSAMSKESRASGTGIEHFVPRIATGFGGGIARNGDICGAVAGGVMAISLALGRDSPEESRDACYNAVDRFYNEFARAFGSCKCRDLTKVDLKTSTGIEAYRSRIHSERCVPIVAWAAKRAYEIIRGSQ